MKSTRRSTLWLLHDHSEDTFEKELTQEDEGYESGSETFHIPTPLRRAPRVYHVSMVDDLSFNLDNFGLITYPSRSTCRAITSQTQMPQPHMLTAWYLPAPMIKVLRDPVNDAAHLPVLIPEVQPPGKQVFHLQYTTTCVTTSNPPHTHS